MIILIHRHKKEHHHNDNLPSLIFAARTMMRMRMMRKLTSVMFFRLVSVIVTHCSDATARACGYRRLETNGWIIVYKCFVCFCQQVIFQPQKGELSMTTDCAVRCREELEIVAKPDFLCFTCFRPSLFHYPGFTDRHRSLV